MSPISKRTGSAAATYVGIAVVIRAVLVGVVVRVAVGRAGAVVTRAPVIALHTLPLAHRGRMERGSAHLAVGARAGVRVAPAAGTRGAGAGAGVRRRALGHCVAMA